MDDKVILDLMRRIIELEERVNKLEKKESGIMKKEGMRDSIKYRYLSRYLSNSNEVTLRLSFKEIEEIAHVDLPDSAYKHRAFWSNTETHSIALSWMSVGYAVTEVNMLEQEIVFDKEI